MTSGRLAAYPNSVDNNPLFPANSVWSIYDDNSTYALNGHNVHLMMFCFDNSPERDPIFRNRLGAPRLVTSALATRRFLLALTLYFASKKGDNLRWKIKRRPRSGQYRHYITYWHRDNNAVIYRGADGGKLCSDGYIP